MVGPDALADRRVEDALTHLWARLPPRFGAHPGSVALLRGALPGDALGFYFEVHFSESRSGQVKDLLVQVPLDRTRCTLPDNAIGETIARLRHWYPKSRVARSCPATAWLELDGALTESPARRPGVSICVDPAFDPLAPPELGPDGLGPSSILDLFTELERALGLPALGSKAIERVCRAWPQPGRIRHLSLMGGRAQPSRKIYGMLELRQLSELLKGSSWSGDTDLAVDLAKRLHDSLPCVHVDAAVTQELMPRLGLEFFSNPPPYEDWFRFALVARALELGLLEPASAEALASWVGSERVRLGTDESETLVYRWFDLKFVLDADSTFLKAYLGARIAPYTR